MTIHYNFISSQHVSRMLYTVNCQSHRHQSWMCWGSRPMFPISCACACTSHETRSHKKTYSAHNVPSKNVFAHISRTSFQIQMSPGKKFYAHRLWNIRGTLATTPRFWDGGSWGP